AGSECDRVAHSNCSIDRRTAERVLSLCGVDAHVGGGGGTRVEGHVTRGRRSVAVDVRQLAGRTIAFVASRDVSTGAADEVSSMSRLETMESIGTRDRRQGRTTLVLIRH
ncbi:hypothetical protein PFISCL1PPCAC_23423, partial [Pristionchus fissidentatus]